MSSARDKSTTALCLLAVAALAGCAGNGKGLDASGNPVSGGGGSTPLTATLQSIQANVFTPICTKCHIGGGAPEGLQRDAAHSYSLLVGVASAEQPSVMRVAPGDPDSSYIIRKLENANLPRSRLSHRTRACMNSTCAKGSMPAAGSSPMRTSFTVKPGPENTFRWTGPISTGRLNAASSAACIRGRMRFASR